MNIAIADRQVYGTEGSCAFGSIREEIQSFYSVDKKKGWGRVSLKVMLWFGTIILCGVPYVVLYVYLYSKNLKKVEAHQIVPEKIRDQREEYIRENLELFHSRGLIVRIIDKLKRENIGSGELNTSLDYEFSEKKENETSPLCGSALVSGIPVTLYPQGKFGLIYNPLHVKVKHACKGDAMSGKLGPCPPESRINPSRKKDGPGKLKMRIKNFNDVHVDYAHPFNLDRRGLRPYTLDGIVAKMKRQFAKSGQALQYSEVTIYPEAGAITGFFITDDFDVNKAEIDAVCKLIWERNANLPFYCYSKGKLELL